MTTRVLRDSFSTVRAKRYIKQFKGNVSAAFEYAADRSKFYLASDEEQALLWAEIALDIVEYAGG